MSKLCYSYVRFSSAEQAKGDSLRRQLAQSQKWAEANGYTIDTSLTLQDLGVSAFRGKNATKGALAGFLEACKTNKIPKGSTLIVESLDRISRQAPFDALALFQDIIRSGVEIVTLKPEQRFNLGNVNRPEIIIAAILVMCRANEESEIKRERVKRDLENLLDKKSARRNRHCPYWLKVVGDKFEIIPERVEAIKQIFKWRNEGLGYQKIVEKLNKNKIKPFNRLNKWTQNYIQCLFRSRSLTGYYLAGEMVETEKGKVWKKYDEERAIKNFYPQVISEKEFNKWQNEREGVGRIGEYVTNLFAGLVFNPVDNAKFQIYYGGKKSLRYLRSDSNLNGGGFKVSNFPLDAFEKGVLAVCNDFPHQAATGGDQQEIYNKIQKMNKQIEKLEERLTEEDEIESLLNAIKKLKKQKQEEEIKIKTSLAVGSIESLSHLLQELKGSDLRAARLKARSLMNLYIKSIELRPYLIGIFNVGCMKINFTNGTCRYLEVMKEKAQYKRGIGLLPEKLHVATPLTLPKVNLADPTFKPLVLTGKDFELPKKGDWGYGVYTKEHVSSV